MKRVTFLPLGEKEQVELCDGAVTEGLFLQMKLVAGFGFRAVEDACPYGRILGLLVEDDATSSRSLTNSISHKRRVNLWI